MSITNPNPAVLVNGLVSTEGVDFGRTDLTITFELEDAAGVNVWTLECINTDEINGAFKDQINLQISITGLDTKVLDLDTLRSLYPTAFADGTLLPYGTALMFRSIVNSGVDINGNIRPDFTTTFCTFILTEDGYSIPNNNFRVGATNETTEGDSVYGWTSKLNKVIRFLSAPILATATYPGIIRLTNDLGGDALNPRVLKINGVSVVGPAPVDGPNTVLVTTSSTAAGWYQIYDGYVAPAAAIQGTKIFPVFGNQSGSLDGNWQVGSITSYDTVGSDRVYIDFNTTNPSFTQQLPGSINILYNDYTKPLYVAAYDNSGSNLIWNRVLTLESADNVFAGDVTGKPQVTLVTALRNKVLGSSVGSVSAPEDGYAIIWNNSAGEWQALLPTGSSPAGAAGGDLSSTYPNPTVAKINGTIVPSGPSSAQILIAQSSSAAQWLSMSSDASMNNAGAVTVVALRNKALDTSVGSVTNDGYYLRYNSGSVRWEAQPINQIGLNIIDSASLNLGAGADAKVLILDGADNKWKAEYVRNIKGKTLGAAIGTAGAGQDTYAITWNNGAGEYQLSNVAIITWAGDLAGSNNTTQIVVSLTGSGGDLPIATTGRHIKFAAAATDYSIGYAGNTASGNGATASILSQTTTDGAGRGGDIFVTSGDGPQGGGIIIISTGDDGSNPATSITMTGGGGTSSDYIEINGFNYTAGSSSTLLIRETDGTIREVGLGGSAGSDGYVVAWNDGASTFELVEQTGGGGSPTGAAGGDLGGTYPNPTVVNLTGTAGVVSTASTVTTLSFTTSAPSNSAAPQNILITQSSHTSASPSGTFTIKAQSGGGGTITGGDIIIAGGSLSGAGNDGNVLLKTGTTTRLTVNYTGVVTIANLSTGIVHSDAAGNLTSSAVNLATADVTGSLTLAGDVSGAHGANTVDKIKNKTLDSSIGTAGAGQDQYVVTWDNGTTSYKLLAAPGAGSGVTTVAAIDTNANANGLYISGVNISTQSASVTNPGMVNTTTQSMAGNKTFTGTVTVSSTFTSSTTSNIGSSTTLNTLSGGIIRAGIVDITANVTCGDGYWLVSCGTRSGDITVTLPSSPATGREVIVKDTSGTSGTTASRKITVDGNTKNIDGSATFVISQDYAAFTFVYTGTQWSIV